MNKQIIEDTMYITGLPINQSEGTYKSDDTPCCVGARLAGYFKIESGNYLEGIDKFAKQLGGNRAHVILMLRDAGAGHNPLSYQEWINTPKSVWQNLLEIEEFPSLKKSSLQNIDFSGADLSRSDFSDADLRGTNLRFANLSNAVLNNANLSNADLYNANLSNANLNSTNLWGTDLSNAKFNEDV